ncbi:hypothetical protein B5M42_024905 [Paenibacillus athensensis]|nr:hypothetical protein [Paenibacillus athensensis]MCD1262025.1 hypothetical protein [Paenibacillus athensensis]
MLEKNINSRYKNWDQIKNDILINDQPVSGVSPIVDNLLNLQIVSDDKLRELKLNQEKEKNEHLSFLKKINYQFKTDVYDPIKVIIDEFNNKHTGNKFRIDSFENLTEKQINIKISLPNSKNMDIRIRPLYDKDFERIVEDRFFETKRKQVIRPKINNQLIIAWGFIEILDSIGFNLLLVEQEDNLYGKWYILKNRVGAFYQANERIVEPFAVDFNGLEDLVNKLNVSLTKIESEVLEGDKIIEVVNELLVRSML